MLVPSLPRSAGRRRFLASLLSLCWFLALGAPGRAESLPVMSPEAQAPLLARLTPWEQIPRLADVPVVPSDDGCVLLSERIVLVGADGRRTSIRQTAYRTLADSGVRSNAEDIIRFRKKEQRAYILLAETIQSDGTRLPVQADAILVQSPQRQADYSLYDDQAEIRVIFPNVKPGSVTHLIYAIEDDVTKFPGEFTDSLSWSGTWPIGRYRYEVDVPAGMTTRLRISTLGSGVPEPVTVSLAGGARRYTWTVSSLPGHSYEIESPPAEQVGPSVRLSTIPAWNDIARWYGRLLSGRDTLNAKLAATVDGWNQGSHGRPDTIARLLTHIADDVRYVGLEFGAADFQPHNCNDVWANQYGDCKDKANLLVACLRHCGIDAAIALVNTEHLGLVDRRAPDFKVFSHAIVAIPQPKGGWLFCDPTIEYASPGLLSSGSTDRDVLVVANDRAEWVHTPADDAGHLTYDFDLKLAPDGEISG